MIINKNRPDAIAGLVLLTRLGARLARGKVDFIALRYFCHHPGEREGERDR